MRYLGYCADVNFTLRDGARGEGGGGDGGGDGGGGLGGGDGGGEGGGGDGGGDGGGGEGDEKLQGWMEGAVAQVFAKKGSGEEFQVQPIAPKEEIASRDQIRKLRRFQGHLRDHDRVMQ